MHQLELGTKFDYIGADAYYGSDADFAAKINDLGQTYMLVIHSDQPIYLEKPELYLPEKKHKRGRRPKRLKASVQSVKVAEYRQRLVKSDWHEIKVRHTAKGNLKAGYHFAKVWIWNKTPDTIEPRILVIRKDKTKKGFEYKYSFTNALPEQYTYKAIANMQAQRFFVEHCIKESKLILGLSQFQTRKYMAWYHQVAMNIISMCFILKEKMVFFEDFPLLSARDIKEWLSFVLMKRYSEMDMLMLLNNRHYRRQRDFNYCYLKEFANVSK